MKMNYEEFEKFMMLPVVKTVRDMERKSGINFGVKLGTIYGVMISIAGYWIAQWVMKFI